MNDRFLLPVFVCVLISACSVEPKQINYGVDHCHYCRMTIVDQHHSAQLVNDKGKAFNFDAVECMINQINSGNYHDGALFLVSAFDNPGVLYDVSSATFLISEGIPSPMGKNLTAFHSNEEAQKTRDELGGTLFGWNELQNRFD
ncbi:nitrous oxide reductase accessory protein NosL [Fulvivirga sedimenti]|uniref:Nitrous oxide reductase accessory protein NosL n=1 Tax=Fulvivirga sedimenti TaxID=2879465 RepID=A0A9X1HM37_9BACT|nr:nitrous oxide reductase accessory protein NosL [Fulvivirga sedimenti]MCA6074391.1 nitrous oxide reductase accessory protein NosL [Fulvivirga sedimenti]